MAITNLTGATVTVPSGWTASAGYGDFYLEGSYSFGSTTRTLYDSEYGNFHIGNSNSTDRIGFTYKSTNIEGLTPATSFTLNITGGTDATNQDLIQWLVDNNAIIEGGVWEEDEPTGPSIQGSAIPGATSYALYEKKNNLYNMLAVSDAIDFNLGKLNLSGGTHSLVIRARAEDYEVSDYSNEVSYSVAADLITFKIRGITYQAEEGTTWRE